MLTKFKLKKDLDKAKLMSRIVIDILQKQVDDYLLNSLEINYDLREKMLRLERKLHFAELNCLNKLRGGMGGEVGQARFAMNEPLGDVTVPFEIGKPNNPNRRTDVYTNKINYFGELRQDNRGRVKMREDLDYQPDYIINSYKYAANEWPAYYDMMGMDKKRYVRS